jgi:predicted acylesterase/phospholipase RssA
MCVVLCLQVAAFLSEQAPIQLLAPCLQPWRGGLLSLDGVVARLSELLPPTFEGLSRDFAVGVVTADGEHMLVDHGPLPEAVAASAAIPLIFSSVDLPGGWRCWC